jgi:hypothetical protein
MRNVRLIGRGLKFTWTQGTVTGVVPAQGGAPKSAGTSSARTAQAVALPIHQRSCLGMYLKMGGAGNLPAPVGNLPSGTAENTHAASGFSLIRNAAAVPSGW